MERTRRYTVTVLADDHMQTLEVPDGANLQQVLLDAGLSPYATLTRQRKGAVCCAPPWRARPLRDLWRLACDRCAVARSLA